MVTQSPETAESPAVSLTAIAPGTVARVAEIAGHCDDCLRLKSLGLCSGRIVQLAAAGDPLIVRVVGARVGVSARLAESVTVVPQQDAVSR